MITDKEIETYLRHTLWCAVWEDKKCDCGLYDFVKEVKNMRDMLLRTQEAITAAQSEYDLLMLKSASTMTGTSEKEMEQE